MEPRCPERPAPSREIELLGRVIDAYDEGEDVGASIDAARAWLRGGVGADEVKTIYVGLDDRFVVSLIVGYSEVDGICSPEQAAAAALSLTRDAGSGDTCWYVHDRTSGETRVIEQAEFEFESIGAGRSEEP
jgi:hypothetical protein